MVTIIAEPNYAPHAIQMYRSLGPVYFWFDLSAKERVRVSKIANILVVRLAVTVSKNLIDSMPKLKIVATSTTGLNHIDVEYLKEKRIKLISLRGQTSFLKNIPSTAEETMALMLGVMRRIPWAFEHVKQGKWDPNRWTGNELKGKTLGIIGFGRLGTLVAGYARSFGMHVIAADPYVSQNVMGRQVKKVSLEKLLKESDVVSLHVLLTDATENMLTEKHFKSMKRSAYFINTARAELIKPGVLYKALTKKWIAGAGIDVLHSEKSDASHLKKDSLVRYAKAHENLLIAPHMGGTTHEAKEITQIFLADLVFSALE